jgi:small-conductance mechanosensitive channel
MAQSIERTGGPGFELRAEQRISRLTLILGLSAAVAVAIASRPLWAIGLAVGTVLSWLNFRWLRRGLDALVRAAQAQAGAEKPRVPLVTYFAAACRYGLIAFAVYAIFEFLKVPLLSMVVGLCALGVAAIAASVYEIWHPAK